MWWSEVCLNFGGVGHQSLNSCSLLHNDVKRGCFEYNLLFPLLYYVLLWVQKLLELEGIKVKAEEEPEGETIVGSGGEALRPLSMDIIYLFSNKFSLLSGVLGQQPP